MTMPVATLGLLPATISHGIGSDSQRPSAIVIVGGLSATLLMSIFVLPVIYVWIARQNDILKLAGAATASLTLLRGDRGKCCSLLFSLFAPAMRAFHRYFSEIRNMQALLKFLVALTALKHVNRHNYTQNCNAIVSSREEIPQARLKRPGVALRRPLENARPS
jgi:hypothetical protein